jgi:hypothetical protein
MSYTTWQWSQKSKMLWFVINSETFGFPAPPVNFVAGVKVQF